MVIGICYDDKTSRDILYEYVVHFSKEYNKECTIYTYDSTQDLLSDKKEFDILLLDLEMQGINDAEFVSWINTYGNKILFIFVTESINYKPEGFLISGFRYLFKPIVYGQLAIELIAAEKVLSDSKKLNILLKDHGRNFYVKIEDICYIESEHNNLAFVLKDRRITNKGTIKSILQSLNQQFCHIHRSYIVNLACIKGRDKNDLLMPDGQRIPVSRYRVREFEKQYEKYWESL